MADPEPEDTIEAEGQGDRLSAVLRALLPPSMADALDTFGDDPAFVAENLIRYIQADKATRADILAFFDGNGPAKIGDADRRLGIPSADELNRWLEDRP